MYLDWRRLYIRYRNRPKYNETTTSAAGQQQRGQGSCNQMLKFALELFHFVFHSLFRIL